MAAPLSPLAAQVLARVIEAKLRCTNARGALLNARSLWGEPLPVADAERARVRLQQLRGVLQAVAVNLATAIACMQAAETLVDRCAALVHAGPLPGQVVAALTDLERARGPAEDAYDAAHECDGRAYAATHLLNYPDLPGLDGVLEHQRVAADGNFTTALTRALDCATQVAEARMALGMVVW